jgi:hypothetical protein
VRATDCLAVFPLPARGKSFDPKVTIPPPEQVFKTDNTDLETVERPEQFPLFAVDQARGGAQRNVTGTPI